MGYNSVVLFLNDGIGGIEKDPEQFGKTLVSTINSRHFDPDRRQGDFAIGNHANAGNVISVEHADHHIVMVVGGNYATVLGHYYRGNQGHHEPDDQLELIKRLAAERGYRLVRNSKKAVTDEKTATTVDDSKGTTQSVG